MDNSIINKIKNELNIVDVVSEYVDLTKKGRNYWGLCPFHQDSNPSMSISPEKQLYKCFVCQNGGDVIKFISEIKNISFQQSISELAKRIGIDYNVVNKKNISYSKKQEKLIEIHKEANNFYLYAINTLEGKEALDYIFKRGLTVSLLERFSIGYAPTKGLKEYLLSKGFDEANIINASLINQSGNDFFRNRLTFGIKNINGDIVSFSARDLSGSAQSKYINSSETSIFSKNNILYNYFDALESIKKNKEVFINEGFMDVIAMYKAGIKNSVAIMGTALTKNHIKLLKNYKVILMLDGDNAGISATIKSIKVLLNNNIETYVIQNNSNKDPDEILLTEGVEKLIEITNDRIEALEYIYSLLLKKYKDLSPKTSVEFIKKFGSYLENQSEIVKDFYMNKLSQTLKISREIIEEHLNFKIKKNKSNYQKRNVNNNYKEPKNTYKETNNGYKLIKSMLKNNNLIEIFKENKPYLVEPILISITNYLIDVNNKKNVDKPSKEMIIKAKEINDYEDFVDTPDEFNELIKRVTIESYRQEKELNDVKLKSTSNEKEKLKLLEKNIKLEQELRKYEE